MIRAGVQPDLLGEIQWWGTDDLWEYALYALVIYVRATAECSGQSRPGDLRSTRGSTRLGDRGPRPL